MHQRAVVGDCQDILAQLPDAVFDGGVMDPPYGLSGIPGEVLLRAWLAGEEVVGGSGYQGLAWDNAVPGPAKWREILRVCKPGAHIIVFSAPRTLDLLGIALRLAGWEVRDMIGWCYSTGQVFSKGLPDGRGTGLKGSWEPAFLCRRPPLGSVSETVERFGTGGLNVYGGVNSPGDTVHHPANLIVDEHQPLRPGGDRIFHIMKASGIERDQGLEGFPDFTGAELTGRAEGSVGIQNRRAGAGRTAKARKNPHATVKPLALCRHLTRLIASPGQILVDPFCGSGSAGCASAAEDMHWLGIDIDKTSVDVANARIKWTLNNK